MRKVFIALIAMAASLPQAARAQERWAVEFWNPKPQPDDLILPMPCGGAMAFRPVPTPLGQGLLADRPAMLGQADAATNYSEFLRQSFIAGPFIGADAAAPPRYYIGKYEVTRDQYSAFTSETCPTPATAGRLPQADIAWHEAIGFTLRYSAWLARNARDALPMRDDARAFVRLPTEDEWEFAARGGAAVSEADFSARVFPMPEGMQRHVWFQGTRSSGGRVRPIGMLEPNPLGIFDILGNVAEWVLEPYRLNRVGRPHGQAGGMVARGGDFLTP
ncbi:MAG: SUMF1/EgtB/PvdO family nonheme iron enzyme, partial [Roseomonas sp.]|nr:SUMF1/EgtB/PvdO family nonheme iron enzyme [Roseomonas sp.]